MTRIHKILVPTDFSEPSLAAVDFAAGLAQPMGARLVLIYIVQPAFPPTPLYEPRNLPEVEAEITKAVEQRLAALRKERIDEAIPSTAIVRHGTPYAEIVAAARDEGVDLIVIATHGHTRLKHLLLGSTAERVVRLAECPVLTVRAGAPAARRG
jgi:nucleotide-binding universal stress UspA family protein